MKKICCVRLMKQQTLNKLQDDIKQHLPLINNGNIEPIMQKSVALNSYVNEITDMIAKLHHDINNDQYLSQIQTTFSKYNEFKKKYMINNKLYVTYPFLMPLDILFSPFAAQIKNIRERLENPKMEETYETIMTTCAINTDDIANINMIFDKLLLFLNKNKSNISFNKYTFGSTRSTYKIWGDDNIYNIVLVPSGDNIFVSSPKQTNIRLSHTEEIDKYLATHVVFAFDEDRYKADIEMQIPLTHEYFLKGGIIEKEITADTIHSLVNLINNIEKLNAKYNLVRQATKSYAKNERRVACYTTYLSFVAGKKSEKNYTHLNKKTVAFYLATVNDILKKIQNNSNDIRIKYFDELHFFTLHHMNNLLTFLNGIVTDQEMLNVAQTTGPILVDIGILNHFQSILNSYVEHYK